MAQTRLVVTQATLASLAEFRREPKFGPAPDGSYVGFLPASERAMAEAAVNGLLDRLIAGLPDHPTKVFVLAEFGRLLPIFEDDDTEDRERLCKYLLQIKDILGIDSLDGLLTRWLYGFDPTCHGN